MFTWFRKMFINPFDDAYEFAISNRKAAKMKKHIFLVVFIIVSFIAVLSSLTLAILSALKLGKLWIWDSSTQNTQEQEILLNDYIYIINTINACVAFISSFGAFFAFKEGYLKNRSLYRLLDFEILMFNERIGNYNGKDETEAKSFLVDRIFKILGWAVNINKLTKLEDEGGENEKQTK